MMFQSFHITLHLFLGNTEQSQENAQDPVTFPDRAGNGASLFGENHATIALVFDKTLGIQALDHVGDARLGNSQTPGNIHDSGISLCINQFLNALQVVFDRRR